MIKLQIILLADEEFCGLQCHVLFDENLVKKFHDLKLVIILINLICY